MGASASHLPAPTHHAAPLSVLNATLGGRVHAAVPFARPCFSLASQGVFGNQDAAACARVTEMYTDRGTLWFFILFHGPQRMQCAESSRADTVVSEFGAYLNVCTVLTFMCTHSELSVEFSRAEGLYAKQQETNAC